MHRHGANYLLQRKSHVFASPWSASPRLPITRPTSSVLKPAA